MCIRIEIEKDYMRIKVRVVPNSKKESIQQIDSTTYRIKVREKAMEGRANEAVLRLITKHAGVSMADVRIIHGLTSREKIIGIKE